MHRIFTILFVLSLNVTIFAQGKTDESCISAKCHPTFGKAKFVHGPVATGDCQTCHRLVAGEKHKFDAIKNVGTLCAACHDPIKPKAVLHSPVAKGQCTACHDPHQSDQPFQMKKGPVAEVCFSCHDRSIIKKKTVHGPTAQGECTTCHDGHTSENPKLLLKAGNDLCFECHTDMKANFASAKQIHKPAAEQCTQCHSPHSNDAPFMLAKEVPDLCFGCHSDIQKTVNTAIVPHKAVASGRKCLNCHSPHEAPHLKQLTHEPLELCLTCHNTPMKTASSGTLTDMKVWLEKNKDWHGPIKDRDCSGCHQVHGGENFRMLAYPYPKEFYTSFSQSQYQLCFSCHEPTLVQDSTTTTLTNFRDGERNLHFLHVNKQVKGRTCRACHETHASQKPKHIREEVPFGKWMLPIGYEKTETGGSCAPGCHLAKKYTRASVKIGKR